MKSTSFGKSSLIDAGWEPSFIDYVLLVQKLQHGNSRRATLVLEAWLILQFISILIPPYADNDSPWKHSQVGILWVALHVGVRFDSLIIDVMKAPIAFYSLLLTLVLLFYWSGGCCIKYTRQLSEADFMKTVILRESANLPAIVKLHLMLVLFFNKVLIVPIVAGVFKFGFAFPSLSAYSIPVILGIFSVVLLPVNLLGYFLVIPINLKTSYQALASPHYSLVQLAFIYFASAFSVLFPVSVHSMFNPIALLTIGGVQCLFIMSMMPYSKLTVNYCNLVLGFLLFYGGAIQLLSYQLFSSQTNESSFVPLLYFTTLLPMLYVLRHLAKQRNSKLHDLRYINSLSDFEFSLRSYYDLDELDDNRKEKVKRRIEAVAHTDAAKHSLVCIWMTYFSMLTENVVMTQFYISLLRTHTGSSLLYFHKHFLMREALAGINYMPNHTETHKFIDFYQSVKALLDRDCKACIAAFDFYTELISLSPKFPSLSRKAKIMTDQWAASRSFYRKLMKLNKHNSELLNYYAGFVEITESSTQSQSLAAQARKEAHQVEKHFALKQDIVSFMDPKCSCFIASLEPADFGIVLWHKNCSGLGLTETELMEAKFEFLVPKLFEDMHLTRIDRLKTYSFDKTKKSYGVLKSGKVIAVLVKLKLVNQADGSLACLIGLRTLPETIIGLGLVLDRKINYAVRAT